MKTIYQHIANTHHRTEKLDIREVGMGVYIGIHRIQEMPFGEIDEARESIVVPYSEIPELATSFQKIVDKSLRDYAIIHLNESKLDFIITMIEEFIPLAERRINVPIELYEFKKELSTKLKELRELKVGAK